MTQAQGPQNMWVLLLLLFVEKYCDDVEHLLLSLNKYALHVFSVLQKYESLFVK